MNVKGLLYFPVLIIITKAVHFPTDPTSELSSDDKNVVAENITDEISNESERDFGMESDDKRLLEDALKIVSNPYSVIKKNMDVIDIFKLNLENISKENSTTEVFFSKMDNLSLDVCKSSQKSLWSYVLDTKNELAKNNMMSISAEEGQINLEYWNILKTKYFSQLQLENNPKILRKIRRIKQRGIQLKLLQNNQPNEIEAMQNIWIHATVCRYNSNTCTKETSRSMSDILEVFKISNDSKELAYYWKSFRDATGKNIRPIFHNYLKRTNEVARSENFSDVGEMWRYMFEDDAFVDTVNKIWSQIKPLYQNLHSYVRLKLKRLYGDEFEDMSIPAHLLGNLWAQDWQAIYSKVSFYPVNNVVTLTSDSSIKLRELFDIVDDFHQSIGFNTSIEIYQDPVETSSDCLPSSHDLCDGIKYKIKWCEENVTDVIEGLSKASRLLSHIQYFKHYRNQDLVFRDGPNPAFKNAISDLFTLQLTSINRLKTLNFVKLESGPEAAMNHLLRHALQKLPVIAYAYTLDKWRWDIFANDSLYNWNEYWWELRMIEMGLSPPVSRSEQDLDPAAKYHVVSHVQYITYLVSHVLEFQILSSLCRRANHTGPLHECSLYGNKEAGKYLSDGMSLGASEDWRTVLHTMTGETELSTEGILSYFSVLNDLLKEETAKLKIDNDTDIHKSAPITVAIVAAILIFLMLVLYCVKKNGVSKFCSIVGLRQNASLDIVTFEASNEVKNEVADINEIKV